MTVQNKNSKDVYRGNGVTTVFHLLLIVRKLHICMCMWVMAQQNQKKQIISF